MASERLQELLNDLAEVRAAMKALRTNGQEHTLNGSHSFKGISYSDLRKEESSLRSQIIAINQGSGAGYTLPNFT